MEVSGAFLPPSAASTPRWTPARLHKNPGVLKRVISNRACLWEHRAVLIYVSHDAHSTHPFHRRSAAASFINKYRFLTVGLGQRAGGYCHGDGMTPRADCRICAYHPICSSAIPPQYILRVVFLRRRSEESRKTIHGRRYVCLLGRQITIQQGHSLFYASALDRFMYGQLVETRYVCMGMTGVCKGRKGQGVLRAAFNYVLASPAYHVIYEFDQKK